MKKKFSIMMDDEFDCEFVRHNVDGNSVCIKNESKALCCDGDLEVTPDECPMIFEGVI